MAMLRSLGKLSSSLAPLRPFSYYMSSLPNLAVSDDKDPRVTWMKQLSASLEEIDPEMADLIELEKARQWKGIDLIPSENFTSVSVLQAVGSVMNHNSEGLPGARYYICY